MKKLFVKLAAALLCVCCVFPLFGCDWDGGNSDNSGQGSGATYVTAEVQYHYQYNVVVEEYKRVTYTLQKDTEREITQFETPPYNLGYRFLGWTKQEGGEGEVISSLTIKGAGGMGTLYRLYAKYEAIEYTVTYHLNGGENSPSNPKEGEALTGKKTLDNPKKRDGYEFGGWYYDEIFDDRALRIELRDNDETEIHLYAKWNKIFTVSYVINIDGEDTDRKFADKYWFETRLHSYTEGYLLDQNIYLNGVETIKGYLFIGWTYEGQETPTRDEEKMHIELPAGSTGDRKFTANYLTLTDLDAVGVGFEDKYDNDLGGNVITLTVPEGVDKIVLGDIAHTIIVIYEGDVPPTLYASQYVKEIEYQKAGVTE